VGSVRSLDISRGEKRGHKEKDEPKGRVSPKRRCLWGGRNLLQKEAGVLGGVRRGGCEIQKEEMEVKGEVTSTAGAFRERRRCWGWGSLRSKYETGDGRPRDGQGESLKGRCKGHSGGTLASSGGAEGENPFRDDGRRKRPKC